MPASSSRLAQRGPDPALPAPPELDAGACALFTDLDGTLAPLEQRPGLVGPDARRAGGCWTPWAAALGGRLAVISGRSLPDLDRILEGADRPGGGGARPGAARCGRTGLSHAAAAGA